MIIDSLLVANGGGSMWSFMIPLLVVVVVMSFISSRSQKKQREKQQQMYNSMVKGTKIRTIGGFTAKVVEVKTDTVMIELADKMPPVEIVKNAIAMVIDEEKAEEKIEKTEENK